MAVHPFHGVSLCSGVAGLDRGVELAAEYLGLGKFQPLLYCEREAACAEILAQRIVEGALPPAPIWSDLGTLAGADVGDYIREAAPGGIGIVFGGIPCTPWSVAGMQLGTSDERDLYPLVSKFVRAHRPGAVFIENVSGFAVRDGLGRVADDLGRMGYRVAAILLRASDVGASHGRLRLFILGRLDHSEGCNRGVQLFPRRSREGDSEPDWCCGELWNPQGFGRGEGWSESAVWSGRDASAESVGALEHSGVSHQPKQFGGDDPQERSSNGNGELEHSNLERLAERCGAQSANAEYGGAECGGCVMANSLRDRRAIRPQVGRGDGAQPDEDGCTGNARGSGANLADASSGRRSKGPRIGRVAAQDSGKGELFPRARACSPLLFAPGPSDPRWGGILAEYPWLAPALESGVRRIPDELADRLDSAMADRANRLRAIGNGVVPSQSALSLVLLWLALDAAGGSVVA